MVHKINKQNVIIPIDMIKNNLKNPRNIKYDEQKLEELKNSMEIHGQLTNIKVDENNTILAGHRRLKAAKMLKWKGLKADIHVGLNEFEKSAIMFTDNTTHLKLDAWEARKTINDIYWNEFCEIYEFRGEKDKGYTTFAKMIGISLSTTRKIIESMSKENIELTSQLRGNNINTGILDFIMESPKETRKELVAEAIRHKKANPKKGNQWKKEKQGDMIEALKLKKQKLMIENRKGKIYPSYISTIKYRLKYLGQAFSKELLTQLDINQKITLAKLIQKNILPAWKWLIKDEKVRKELKIR